MARKLEVQIVGDASSLKRALGDAEKRAGKFGRSMGSVGKLAGAAGLAGGVALAVGALKSAVGAAKEAEVSQKKMEAQLRASGIAYGRHKDQIENTIQAQSRLAAFDDEDLQDSFTNLVRTTGDVNEALKLNALAADLARGKNMSLEAASKVIGKVAAGNVGALGRLGIALGDGATKTEALAAVQKKFGGQAEAFGNTAAGSQQKFQVALENLQESIGKHVLPVLTDLMVKATEAVVWLEDNWPRISKTVRDVFETLRPIIEPIMNQIRNVIETVTALIRGDWDRVWQGLLNTVKNALALILGAVKLYWQLFKAVWRRLGELAIEGIKAGLAGVENAVWSILKGIGSFIAGKAAAIVGWGKDIAVALKDGIVDGLKGIGQWIVDQVKGAINALVRRVNSLLQFSINIPDRIPGLPDQINVNPPDIPQLAKGAQNFVGGLAMVGERGPELVNLPRGADVIPTHRLAFAGMGGGGDVHIHVAGFVGDERTLARVVREEFARFQRRNGRSAV
jgi:phage-related protein